MCFTSLSSLSLSRSIGIGPIFSGRIHKNVWTAAAAAVAAAMVNHLYLFLKYFQTKYFIQIFINGIKWKYILYIYGWKRDKVLLFILNSQCDPERDNWNTENRARELMESRLLIDCARLYVYKYTLVCGCALCESTMLTVVCIFFFIAVRIIFCFFLSHCLAPFSRNRCVSLCEWQQQNRSLLIFQLI